MDQSPGSGAGREVAPKRLKMSTQDFVDKTDNGGGAGGSGQDGGAGGESSAGGCFDFSAMAIDLLTVSRGNADRVKSKGAPVLPAPGSCPFCGEKPFAAGRNTTKTHNLVHHMLTLCTGSGPGGKVDLKPLRAFLQSSTPQGKGCMKAIIRSGYLTTYPLPISAI